MKHFIYALVILFCFLSFRANAQLTITNSASGGCMATDTLTAHLTGDVPTDCSIGADDVYSSAFGIGFTFKFYGTNYTQVLVGANGTLCFDMTLAGGYAPYSISGALLGNTEVLNSICGPWCDIDYADYGGTCTYSVDGVAPNRKFVVTFCQCYMFTSDLCPGEYTTTQMVLYETSNLIDVFIAHKTICTAWNGGYAICGVQNAAGTAATVAPARDWTPPWSVTNEAWRFTPVGAGGSYTVAPITFAPVPYAASTIYWYNAATHAYLGTGSSLVVSPTATTTYEAVALGCADSSFAYITVPATTGPHITAITKTNPTSCGASDGTIKLYGITPHQIDSVFETIDGVPVLVWIDSTAADSIITLTGLAAGTYTFYIKVGPCVSNTVTITLTSSTLAIYSSFTNPTLCGKCDGTIKIHGLWPGVSATITYNFDGVPQTYTGIVATDSTITLSGLCVRYPTSVFSSIVATLGGCTATTPDITLTNPTINDYGVSPSLCGRKDGYIKLYNLPAGAMATVSYVGAIGSPVSLTVAGTDTLTVPFLSGGTYASIIAQINIANCPAPDVTLTMPPISGYGVSPSLCGRSDGYIKLYNLPADSLFTVTFTGAFGSGALITVAGDDTLTIPNLNGGTYGSLTASLNGVNCTVPDITLTVPTISGYGVSPSLCGKRDGYIKLYNLPADSLFTVSYVGAPFSPVMVTVAADDTLTVPYLSGGTYTSISATINGLNCTVPAITLTDPPINASFTNPTICGKNDGTITLYTLPTDSVFFVTFSGPVTVSSPGESLTVDATGTLTIPSLLAGLYPSPYTSIVASINGIQCPLTVPVTLTDPPVTALFTSTIQLGCQGDEVTVISNSTPPGYTNTWNYGDGSSPIITTATSDSHTYSDYPSYTGSYIIKLYYHTFGPGCMDSASIPVNFNHPILAVFTPLVDTVCFYPVTPVNFNSSGSIGSSLSYEWTFGDGSISTDVNPAHTYQDGGVFNTKLTVTDTLGCNSTVYGTVDVIQISVKTVTHDTTVCLVKPLELIAHPGLEGNNTGVSFAWAPTNNLSNYTDSITYFMGIGDFSYTVTVIAAPSGCPASDVEVIHSMPPLTLTNVTPSQVIPYGSSIRLNADGAQYFTWFPNDGTLNNANINDPVATPLDSTTYVVYGMNVYGCKDSAFITITLDYGMTSFIPSAFTPNGDGLNDKFRVVNLKYQKLVDMKIFNRWGEQLFQTNNPLDGWDGTYRGEPQDMGTYNYAIILSRPEGTNQVYTGTVTLIR